MTHRLLPQSPDAEKGILCSLLLSPYESVALCDDAGLDAEWFHIPAHAEIYRAIRHLLDTENVQLDFIRLTSYLRDVHKLEAIGGAAFVTHLWTFLPTAVNLAYYLDECAKKHRLRRIISIGTEYASRAYDEPDRAEELASEFEAQVMAISEGKTDTEKTNKELVAEVIKDIQTLYENQGKITGIATGLTEYDNITDGLHPCEMSVFAARPSVGKTAFALSIILHILFFLGIPVIFVSGEMSAKQIIARLLYMLSNVNRQRVKSGLMSEGDFMRMAKCAEQIAKSLLFIIDNSKTGGTIQRIRSATRSKVRMLRKQGHERIVFIGDYLQLFNSSSQKAKSREQEVSDVSQSLKKMSMELNIPVVVLAQLNRDSVKTKRRPKMSDLRESGAIEQDADNIGLLIRPEMDCEDDDPEKDSLTGLAELDIAKHRNGPTGETIKLHYEKQFARFENKQ